MTSLYKTIKTNDVINKRFLVVAVKSSAKFHLYFSICKRAFMRPADFFIYIRDIKQTQPFHVVSKNKIISMLSKYAYGLSRSRIEKVLRIFIAQ